MHSKNPHFKLDTEQQCVPFKKAAVSFLIFSVLVLTTLIGCTTLGGTPTADPLVDTSFLTGQPCAAPCWYGLELDKSTKEDVYNTLKQLPLVDASSIKEFKTALWAEPIPEIEFDCRDPKISSCTEIFIEDGLVKQIMYTVGFDLPLERVVEKLGVPEYVQFAGNPNVGGTRMSLFWPSKLIAVEHVSRDDKLDYSLRSGQPVPRGLLAGSIYYTAREHFGLIDGSYRISWPGFAN